MNESRLDTHAYPPEVTLQIDQEDEDSYSRAAASINAHAAETIVIVQHEYGIYGGDSGSLLVGFLEKLRCPVITTLHTVVAEPSYEMRAVTEQIIANSDRLITLTDTSYKLFASLYPSAQEKLVRIMHGIHPLLYKQPKAKKAQFGLADRSVLLTFGLLSRNKGIEYIISALPSIKEKIPNVMYLVLGATHPGVLRQEGEAYRLELMGLVKSLSLEGNVRFVDDFLPVKEILEYLQATDVYVATSLDPQQAVSGTLSYALGAGRAVIATNFAQAKEIVSQHVGRIVSIRDSGAVSEAAIELFAAPDKMQSMNHAAFAQTRSMLWTNVADDYAKCLADVARINEMRVAIWPPLKWDHLLALTDEFGMYQFSQGTYPQPASGYTLDDNSRALQAVNYGFQAGLITEKQCNALSGKYLQVMEKCLSQKPSVNYISATTKRATTQNLTEDLSDSMARAYYALRTVSNIGPPSTRAAATSLISKLPDSVYTVTQHIRTNAQALLGTAFGLDPTDNVKLEVATVLANSLVGAYRKSSTPKWRWFDTTMTYANGQLCSSLIEAARMTGLPEFREVGLESLEFLCRSCFMGEVYAPIGQNGWHNRDGSRSLFDQQPEDAFSMMQALESAYNLTGDGHYVERAAKVFSWFMGNNLIGTRVYDDSSGGCHDGLTPNGVNQNEGAESTLSYIGARLIMERLQGKLSG